MIKTILTIHSGKPARQNRNNRKYTDPLEKKINKLIEKDLIDKWAFPYNLFNLSSLQKTGHKKPYLHAHWQPFSPTQWQTFSILSPKASTKSLPERHYWQFEKNNASRLSVSVQTYRLTNATVCVLKRRTTKIKSISTIKKGRSLTA